MLQSVARRFQFFQPRQQFTIGWLGGWGKVEKRFFDLNHSVMATIEQGLGG